MLKRELYLKRIEQYIGQDTVKLITGVRRSGKTTLLRQLIEELQDRGVPEKNIISLDFDGLRCTYLSGTAALSDMLTDFLERVRGHAYVFLDELPAIAFWARVLADLMRRFDCEFFVCASGSRLFYEGYQQDLAYHLVRIEVYPLVFSEFLALCNEREEAGLKSREELFAEFLRRGAMPAAYAVPPELAENCLRDTYSAIILKDVVETNKLRDISHIGEIMQFLFSHIGETFSPKGIRDYVRERGVRLSVDTVYSFLNALIGARLIYRVPRYDIKAAKVLETQEKYYVCDLGMCNAVVGQNTVSASAALENVLYMELLSRGFHIFVGKNGKWQIDFMAVKEQNRTYLNCCERLSDAAQIRAEFMPLMKIQDNYFKLVLSLDAETRIDRGGIVNYPLIRFLEETS